MKYNAQMVNYDIRKLREHGIFEKESWHNRYHLTGFGRMFVKAFTVWDEKVIKPFVKKTVLLIFTGKTNKVFLEIPEIFNIFRINLNKILMKLGTKFHVYTIRQYIKHQFKIKF